MTDAADFGVVLPKPAGKTDAATFGVSLPGKPNTSDEGYTGSILPFRRDASGLHLAVPEMIAAPLRGIVEGSKRAAGVGEAGQNPLRPLSTDEMAAVGAVAGSPIGGAEIGAGIAAPAEVAAGTAARAAGKVENQARSAISTQFAKGAAGGSPTASDVLQEITRARREGQPLALVDINNPSLGALAGATYRQGGAARAVMKGFLDTRGAAAVPRTQGIINRHLADDSYRATANKLIEDRSARARPLWDEARQGGSLAPLTHQFQEYFNESGKAEQQAAADLSAAQVRLTQARARQSQAGNVYSASGSNREFRDAEAQTKAAQAALQKMQAEKSKALELLRQAQADGSANAPGAVWSPRLQEFLDQPEVQQGIRRGYAIERRKAVGEGRPFNPSEYAVISEENGNPVVGKVPNMALLMVAKEGLDAIIDSSSMKNQLTGRPTKSGLSYMNLRDGFVTELDRLNPLYKQARDVWSGDTASIRSLDDGRNFLNQSRFSPEELAEHVAKMSNSDRQFFIVGVADSLKNKLFKSADTAAGTRAVINTEDARMRLRPLFGGDDQAAQQFIDAMERERTMTRTGTRVYGGSPTAERIEDDRATEVAMHAAHGIVSLLEGRFLSAAASALRSRRLFGGRPNPELSEAIARALVDPDIDISEIGPLLPQKPIPARSREIPKLAAPALARSAPFALGGSLPATDTDPYGSRIGAPQ